MEDFLFFNTLVFLILMCYIYKDYTFKEDTLMIMSEKEFNNLCKKLNIPKDKLKKKTTKKANCEFDSLAEKNFYDYYVTRYLKNKFITKLELHNQFVIVDAVPEYKLKSKVFNPDFIITTAKGETFVIEMKGKVVRKLQRDYGLRKQLFILKYCLPNGWKFIELKSEDWTQDPIGSSQQNIINF